MNIFNTNDMRRVSDVSDKAGYDAFVERMNQKYGKSWTIWTLTKDEKREFRTYIGNNFDSVKQQKYNGMKRIKDNTPLMYKDNEQIEDMIFEKVSSLNMNDFDDRYYFHKASLEIGLNTRALDKSMSELGYSFVRETQPMGYDLCRVYQKDNIQTYVFLNLISGVDERGKNLKNIYRLVCANSYYINGVSDSRKIKDENTPDVLDGVLFIAFTDGTEDDMIAEVNKHANESDTIDGVQYETYETDSSDGVAMIDMCAATGDANAFVKALLNKWGIAENVADLEFEASDEMKEAVNDSRKQVQDNNDAFLNQIKEDVENDKMDLDKAACELYQAGYFDELPFNRDVIELCNIDMNKYRWVGSMSKKLIEKPLEEAIRLLGDDWTLIKQYEDGSHNYYYKFVSGDTKESGDEEYITLITDGKYVFDVWTNMNDPWLVKTHRFSDSRVNDMTKPAHLRGYAEKMRAKRRNKNDEQDEPENENQKQDVADSRRVKDDRFDDVTGEIQKGVDAYADVFYPYDQSNPENGEFFRNNRDRFKKHFSGRGVSVSERELSGRNGLYFERMKDSRRVKDSEDDEFEFAVAIEDSESMSHNEERKYTKELSQLLSGMQYGNGDEYCETDWVEPMDWAEGDSVAVWGRCYADSDEIVYDAIDECTRDWADNHGFELRVTVQDAID